MLCLSGGGKNLKYWLKMLVSMVKENQDYMVAVLAFLLDRTVHRKHHFITPLKSIQVFLFFSPYTILIL